MIFCQVENISSAQGVVLRSVYSDPRQTLGGYIAYPLLSLEVATPEHNSKTFGAVIRMRECMREVLKSASQAVLL